MQLPTHDSAHFNGFGGDSYNDAKGETVVIAVLMTSRLVHLKSTTMVQIGLEQHSSTLLIYS